MESTYFRKGFGLKAEVEALLSADYSGRLVDLLRERDYTLSAGGVTVRLAHEFGFCYGVERAVEYAYQTRRKFPDRRVVLLGEIIHNPHVNAKLREMDVTILPARAGGSGAASGASSSDASTGGASSFDLGGVRPDDVVIVPA